ncbi:MAG: redox-sensing transcriptional repressor Rex [Planctomycetota bacterium]|jgi:redox-sensing transcriptional repressor
MAKRVSFRTVGRLGLYRRLLHAARKEGIVHIFSHQLAEMAMSTPAQVRRDLMVVGCTGSPAKGYEVVQLIEAVSRFLDAPKGQSAILVGVGNLGRALLAHLSDPQPALKVVAAFDTDPRKVGRQYADVACRDMADLRQVVREQNVDVGIVAVPAAPAQAVAEALLDAGITGLLNFTARKLIVPSTVYVEDIHLRVSLERVAFMARRRTKQGGDAKRKKRKLQQTGRRAARPEENGVHR